ncbi:head maturation protease, ClpP-related [Pararhodobacter marinus]|uniref:head maturation protease, ClpP-related n=1 Tax=Pararhodobacter marinus TaxID=2184063 RepID=UPI003513939F
MKKGSDLILNGELILAGMVLMDDYAGYMWEEDVWFSPRLVREALLQLDEGEVTVRISSSGGHAVAGESIRAILAAHPGGTRMIVEGAAYSAASLIFMAGRTRLMSAGSMLMIHDPSGAAWGTEEAMRTAADVIGKSAATYAAVYAAAAGMSTDEAREIMKTETWYTPEEAIASGFATGISDASGVMPGMMSAQSAEAGRALIMAQVDLLTERLSQKPQRAERPVQPIAASGAPLAAAAETLENPTMSKPNPGTTVPPTNPKPQEHQAAIMAERQRIADIRTMAAPFLLSGRLVEGELQALIDDGTSAAEAGTRLLAAMAAAEPPVRTPASAARITRDETDTRLEGMIGALMGKTDGPAETYRGMRLKRLAMELGASAGRQSGYSETDAVKRGMMATTMLGGAIGVSDFAYITTEVMGRSLIAEYQRRTAQWQLVTGTAISAADFREIYAVRFGGDFQLKDVLENGEYQTATLKDETEGLRVQRKGRTIALTFEAVINDDMGAFQRIPREFATAARTMESSMVWSLIRANSVLKSDGLALFHADHGNLATSAGAISETTIAAARKAMAEMKAFGSKDPDDFIVSETELLLVPPALELAALKFKGQITATKTGDVNPYREFYAPHTIPNLGAAAGGSDTAWYLIDPDMPPIQHAYLEGHEAPTIVTVEGMNPDVVRMNARHIFGAAAVEFRGAYKNAGA